jgi:hypothetical protein
MKDRVLRFSALLLVIWYCFSVIGFGIHTCKASERSFVATFISGLTCADIHPEHKCDKGKCCSHASHDCCESHAHDGGCCGDSADDGMSLHSPSCCSNDYLALVITGCATDNEDLSDIMPDSVAFSVVNVVADDCQSNISSYKYRHKPESGPRLNADIQSLLNIWRI